MRDLKIGDEITAVVLSTDDGKGNLVLSRKEAANDIAWENLETGKAEGTLYPVKISKSVNGGFIAFVNGIRGFIPISRLSLRRIEEDEKEQYVGTTVEVVIIDLNKEKNSLVLSAREQEEKKAQEEKAKRFSAVSVGMVSKGTVESIMPYGCFVNLGEGLSGLVHISQIAHKRLKTPNEEVKIGQEVDVKVIDIKDGKISLSMKALVDFMEKNEEIDEGPCEIGRASCRERVCQYV